MQMYQTLLWSQIKQLKRYAFGQEIQHSLFTTTGFISFQLDWIKICPVRGWPDQDPLVALWSTLPAHFPHPPPPPPPLHCDTERLCGRDDWQRLLSLVVLSCPTWDIRVTRPTMFLILLPGLVRVQSFNICQFCFFRFKINFVWT